MSETITFRVPPVLAAAIAQGAAGKLQTPSEYLRQAALEALRRDGLDPVRADAKRAA